MLRCWTERWSCWVERSCNNVLYIIGGTLQWDVSTSIIFDKLSLTVQDTQCKALHGLYHPVHYDSHTSTHLQAAHPLSWTPGPPAAPPLNTGRSPSGQLHQTGWTSAYWRLQSRWYHYHFPVWAAHLFHSGAKWSQADTYKELYWQVRVILLSGPT